MGENGELQFHQSQLKCILGGVNVMLKKKKKMPFLYDVILSFKKRVSSE